MEAKGDSFVLSFFRLLYWRRNNTFPCFVEHNATHIGPRNMRDFAESFLRNISCFPSLTNRENERFRDLRVPTCFAFLHMSFVINITIIDNNRPLHEMFLAHTRAVVAGMADNIVWR